MDDLDDKPNIKRIYVALTEGGLKGKYTKDTCGIDLSEAFFQFIIEEEFDDYQICLEFEEGEKENSFFIDWLNENKNINESNRLKFWDELNLAYKSHYDPIDLKEELKYEIDIYAKYNIKVNESDLKFIKQQLSIQCSNWRIYDVEAICTIIQIGKQNGNEPL
eukprot:146470_1